MADRILPLVCPCLFGEDIRNEPKKLMELTPCKSSTSDDEASSSSLGGRAQGLLGMAMAPVARFQQQRAEEAARRERAAALMDGMNMKLLQSRGSIPVRIALSRDSAMVTYQSLNGTSESGVISLAIVREVKPVVSGGILRSQTPVPMQWMIVADDETLKLEAPTESVKEQWMTTIADLAKRQAEAKVQRKMGYTRKKLHELDERKKEAERRKAEVLKTCGSGGMKHTAAAMMNRR